jgi:hypothetical protein
VVETPVVETPVAEAPVAEAPVVETAVVETAVVETAVVEATMWIMRIAEPPGRSRVVRLQRLQPFRPGVISPQADRRATAVVRGMPATVYRPGRARG